MALLCARGIFFAMRSSTVLIVDDDEVGRKLLEGLLAREDYTVVAAQDGREALDLAARVSPDVVLLDVVMPEVDGFEVCRQLRSNPSLREIPIILLTALDSRGARLRGLAAGADEFLTKPVDPVELRTRVRTITGLNRFRRLCDERARFEAAVAHSPVSIALTDSEGRILHANHAFQNLIGVLPERILDCFPTPAAKSLANQLNRSAALRASAPPLATSLLISRVPEASAEVTVVQLPSSDGALFEFMLRDTTDQRQLELQLFRLQQIDLLGQLASGVVHDVNNLLMSVIGNAEMLESDGGGPVQERAKVIRQSAQQGATLLRRILMFGREENQPMTPIQLSCLLREAATTVGKLVGKAITLDIDSPACLPAIRGDGGEIHQVIMNLCLNARDAMPAGGSILCSARAVSLTEAAARGISPDAAAGEFVAISVRDTGPGISAEVRRHLFDPFFTTKRREVATGLGLATVLRVMRHHRGFVGVETKVGEGACFTCYFPVAEAGVAAA